MKSWTITGECSIDTYEFDCRNAVEPSPDHFAGFGAPTCRRAAALPPRTQWQWCPNGKHLLAIRETLKTFDIDVRAGIHTGEIEVRGDDVAGLAVHICARVTAFASPGEVLVSSTVRDLVAGSSVEFAERGEYLHKGVPGSWRLFAVGASPNVPKP